MNTLKQKNMMNTYKGFKGTQTVGEILKQIPDNLLKSLTGKELGLMMNAINTAYHNGKAFMGSEVIDGNKSEGAVWIQCLDKAIEWKNGDLKFSN